jgi:hypothetical protein
MAHPHTPDTDTRLIMILIHTLIHTPQNRDTLPKNYHFHKVGAGGVDGSVSLHEYDWDQV